MEIIVRHAVLDEAEMLADLAARTFYDAFAPLNKHEDIRAYIAEAFTPSRMRADIGDPLVKLLIAEVGGEPAGYAKLHAGEAPECVTGPAPVLLTRIYAEQKWLGGGVGGALMRACIDEARQAKHQTIYLGCWEKNHRAMAFYQKWGFKIVGNYIFHMGDEEQADWWMELRI